MKIKRDVETYKNYFSIEEILPDSNASDSMCQDNSYLYAINIINPGVFFRNIRNLYYHNWGYDDSPITVFKKRVRIIQKNNLNPEDIAVYALNYSSRCPKP